MSAPKTQTFIRILLLAALYIAVGKLGLSFALINQSVSPIWPPTGLSLAALILFGSRLWPGIFLGAFVVNLSTSGTVLTAGLIACGNTLEAILGASLVKKFSHGRNTFDHVENILKFSVLAGVLATTISPTIGLTALAMFGFASWDNYFIIWMTWWLGDMGGALVVTPLLTLWGKDLKLNWNKSRTYEATALFCTLLFLAIAVFGPGSSSYKNIYATDFLCISVVLWSAFRFGLKETAFVSFVLSLFAIAGTVQGYGPFITENKNESLLLLQLYLGFTTISGLLVSAAIAAHRQTQHRLEIQYVTARELTQSQHLDDAISTILKEIGERFQWDAGAFWLVDEDLDLLECRSYWTGKSETNSAFENMTRKMKFSRGVGLPGRVWANVSPSWIEAFNEDKNFPRASAAGDAGYKGGFGFPILIDGGKCIGVIEFFTKQVRARDDELMRMFFVLGSQMGRFIALKNAEYSIRSSEMRYRAITESALDCIISMDSNGRIQEFNPAAEKTFGLSREEVIGKTVSETIVPESLREKHSEGLARFLKTGEMKVIGQRVEMPTLRGDGTEFPVEIAITAIPGEDKEIFFTAYLRDLTEQKKAAEIVRKRADELAEASRLKDEFIAMLSHELRNPLSTISTGIQLASRHGKGVDVDSIHKTVLQEIKHLVRLIDDLLDVSRITRGKINLKKVPYDIGESLRESLESAKNIFSEKMQKLTVSIPDEEIIVDADPARLKQIFINLLTNASKYTDKNGLIAVSMKQTGNSVEVRIKDSGIGMSQEMISRVFDLFAQADNSLARSQGGLGIGLTLVERLTNIHGGNVRAESAGPGKGCEFILTFPTLDKKTLPFSKDTISSVKNFILPPSKILIVDDNKSSAELLGKILEEEGHSVKIVEDGFKAIDIAPVYDPAIILLDIGLPEMSGYEVANHIRNIEKLKSVCVVGISGYGQEQDMQQSKEAGFDYHLVKPIEYSVLQNILSTHFSDKNRV